MQTVLPQNLTVNFCNACIIKCGCKKGKGVPNTGHEGPVRDVEARVHIYTAIALGRGREAGPMLGCLYPRYSFYRRLSELQGQSEHEGVKKSRSSDTRAIQPVAKCLAAWATWPTNVALLGDIFFTRKYQCILRPFYQVAALILITIGSIKKSQSIINLD